MKVALLSVVDNQMLNIIKAIRTCWDSVEMSDSYMDLWTGLYMGENDTQLLRKIIQSGHTSTIEHMSLTFEISGVSRALLQELARHRIASLSVKSTRYTLKRDMRGELQGLWKRTGNEELDGIIESHFANLQAFLDKNPGIERDIIKYGAPEALFTDLVFTINARSLRNLFALRTSKRALPEFRRLCGGIWGVLPDYSKILFEDIYNEEAVECA